MMDESRLTEYYSAMAEIVDELIPCEWERVVMYAEEMEDSSAASFYFYTSDGAYYYSGNIWDEFDVSEDKYDELMDELLDTTEALWMEFKSSGEEPWCSFTFELDKDWKFKIKYSYDPNEGLGRVEKVLRWAYDELEIVPKDNYRRTLLKEYLEAQGRELPEELKDI